MTTTTATGILSAGTAMEGVTLHVEDLPAQAAYYREALGLVTLEEGDGTIALGRPGSTVVVLRHTPGCPARPAAAPACSTPRSCSPRRPTSPRPSSPRPATRARGTSAAPTTSSARRSTSPIPRATGSSCTPTGRARSGSTATVRSPWRRSRSTPGRT
ncbi:hypothetical protein [Cellulomonas sp. ATA003]|uniref:VOC family protein n=1 Tax=Cellulomonas sp. ATA003 TaxID=3073064 RepID=UPI002872BEC8|nr:hypothetical protein [Cellulomonas sp. ATA003]WNB86233.1 hypothetical protein REH70_02905 [Cellulomonas sp. ATA003]